MLVALLLLAAGLAAAGAPAATIAPAAPGHAVTPIPTVAPGPAVTPIPTVAPGHAVTPIPTVAPAAPGPAVTPIPTVAPAAPGPAELQRLALAKESTRHLPAVEPGFNTEGGRVSPGAGEAPLAVAKSPDNTTILDRELGTSASKSSSKARKGVEFKTITSTVQPMQKNVTMLAAKPVLSNLTATHSSLVHNGSIPIPVTDPPPKKPLVLVSWDDEDVVLKEKSVQTSKVPSVASHPNLVIPVTITVFALPLFAVLGYYALKHGREAWKNRHYRRMDFLLDGMYND